MTVLAISRRDYHAPNETQPKETQPSWAGSGWFWFSGWFWLLLAASGWFWLLLAASGCLKRKPFASAPNHHHIT